MQNVFVSFSPINLFILLGEDPNQRPGTYVKLTGISQRIERFSLAILNEQLQEVFSKDYKNIDAAQSSLLEFYTGGHPEGRLLKLVIDDFEKTIPLAS